MQLEIRRHPGIHAGRDQGRVEGRGGLREEDRGDGRDQALLPRQLQAPFRGHHRPALRNDQGQLSSRSHERHSRSQRNLARPKRNYVHHNIISLNLLLSIHK